MCNVYYVLKEMIFRNLLRILNYYLYTAAKYEPPEDKIGSLMDFLNAYLHFDEKEINYKFEQELKVLTNKSETMGITEQILDIAEKRGEKKGLLATAERMLKNGLDISLARKCTGLPLAELKRLAATIK